MAEAAGMVIPKATSTGVQELKNIDLTSSTIEVMLETFFKFSKKDQERMTKQLESVMEYNKQISDYTKPDPKQETIKKKLSKYYQKWFLQKDFLKMIGGFFKKLIDRAGGWLMDLLKMLFLLAIFDPKGKFLNSIMNFLIGILETVLRTIINWLPAIAKRMWNLFWDELVPGFGRLGKMIGDTLSGKDSLLGSILEKVGKAVPVLIGVLGVVSKLWPVLSFLATALWGAITAATAGTVGFTATASAIWSAVWPVLAVIAAIVALVAVLYLVWKYWDVIKQFFADLWRMFTEASAGIQAIVVGLIAVLIALLMPVWVALFSAIVTGAIALWSLVAAFFTGFIPILWSAVVALFAFLLPILLFVIPILLIVAAIYLLITYSKEIDAWWQKSQKRFGKWLASIKKGFLDWWKNFSFKKLVAKMIDGIFGKGTSSKIGKVLDYISDVLTSMSDWINAFFNDPMAWLSLTMSDAESNRRKSTSKSAVKVERLASGDYIDQAAAASLAKKMGVASFTGMSAAQIQAMFEALHASKSSGVDAYKIRTTLTAIEKQAKDFRTNAGT